MPIDSFKHVRDQAQAHLKRSLKSGSSNLRRIAWRTPAWTRVHGGGFSRGARLAARHRQKTGYHQMVSVSRAQCRPKTNMMYRLKNALQLPNRQTVAVWMPSVRCDRIFDFGESFLLEQRMQDGPCIRKMGFPRKEILFMAKNCSNCRGIVPKRVQVFENRPSRNLRG